MSAPDPGLSSAAAEPEPRHDPYAALRLSEFRWFLSGNMLYLMGLSMQTCAISWEIYERTGSNLALALVGLVQIVPVVSLFLSAGHLVDQVDRRKILIAALAAAAMCSAALTYCSASAADIGWMYVLLLFIGLARTFMQPARSAFLPQIMPRQSFSNAVTWHSSGFQLTAVLGPGAAGLLIAWRHSAALVYALTALLALINCACLAMIRSRPLVPAKEPRSLASFAAGLSF